MIGKVQFKVGNVTYGLEIDERGELETLHKMIVLGNPPTYCKFLPDGKYSLETNKDKEGNTYINVFCRGKDKTGTFVAYRSKLGQYKTGGYFWNTFEKYEFDKSEVTEKTSSSAPQVETDDDIPF